ncbi:MAG: InlB B-repeat-containing protein [Clostridia bacterium]|nr:InlB B-repeat-containing protein [Clostridia bacterium]
MGKKISKKALSLVIAMIMVLSAAIVPMTAIVASAANDTMATARDLIFGTTYSGAITESDTVDYYQFTLPTSGKINFDLKADGIHRMYAKVYDENGALIWAIGDDYWGIEWNSTTEKISYNVNANLTSGTYYLYLAKRDGTGNYNVKIEFTSADETFLETNGGSDNIISKANDIKIGDTYKGQLAINDGEDYYKFVLPSSGKMNFDIKADGIQRIWAKVFDENGVHVWTVGDDYWGIEWNSTTKKISYNVNVNLTSGTYYLYIARRDGNGNYNFTLNYTSANESFNETGFGTNNSMSEANEISTGITYNGQIAFNDDKDFYKFTIVNTQEITVNFYASGITRVWAQLFDENGVHIWTAGDDYWALEWNKTSKEIVNSSTVSLSAGTYYYYVARNDGNGNYSFSICEESQTATPAPNPDTPVVTTYTLSYNANGGSGAPAAQTGASTYTISTTVPVRSGYKFLGWAFDKNAASASCTGGANITISSDTVLYAVWQKVETPPVVTAYTLSYNANGGSGAPAAQTGSTTYTISTTVPVRSGYKFLGWATSASATSAAYTAGKTITLTKNTVLYAVWQVAATEPAKFVCPYCGEKFGAEDKYEDHVEEEIISRNIAVVFRNPSTTLINYGDSIILHVDTYNLPEGSTIKWSVSNGNFAIVSYSVDRESCTITPNNTGDTVITATVYDAEGKEICSDSQMMSAKAGIWQKIVAFFKKLFGLTKTIPEALRGMF